MLITLSHRSAICQSVAEVAPLELLEIFPLLIVTCNILTDIINVLMMDNTNAIRKIILNFTYK